MAIEYLSKGNDDGTSFGNKTTEKVSLYGVTPVVQAATIADAVVGTGAIFTVTVSAGSTAVTHPCSNADHNALVTIVNTLLSDLSDLGINAAS
jgi:hypothetical protein